MANLSPHFSESEFVCRGRDGCTLIPPTRRLLNALEQLRADLGGKPLRIISGYRCPKRNRAVGGAPASRHLRGDAVDVAEGVCTVAQAVAAGFTGIGSKGRWAVHLDTRPAPARWTY